MHAAFAFFLLYGLLSASPAFSSAARNPADGAVGFEEGVAAYQRGDYINALRIWQRSAEAGDARATYNIGVLFDQGQGVPVDSARAAVYFLHAAQAGHARAMSNYGRLLEQGRGVEKNEAEAALWFHKAAEEGIAEAQYNLGLMYEGGRGVPRSERDAAAWYSRAAASGQSSALERLGLMYRDGRGVTRNATRATLLLYGAAMDGRQAAVQALEGMVAEPVRLALFGRHLDGADRTAMRAALAAAGVTAVRENNHFSCDVYKPGTGVPGASDLAVCYGPPPEQGAPSPLGFVKIDYPAPDATRARQIYAMVEKRFGPPSASEGPDNRLWNLGPVIVATKYAPELKQLALMYMVPKVYHLTRRGRAAQ
ncbi:MAG: sel1 repeat family protein [Desulfovibrio sp.]|nr:sel1 repeat family protein [Desulfovibrio sp.]